MTANGYDCGETRETRESALEIKFLVTEAQGEWIREWARDRMGTDPNADGSFSGGYLVSSLYFDTQDRAVYNRRGSFGRSKYRVRRYGQSEIAFLERKLKTHCQVTKRRSWIGLDDLPLLDAVAGASGGPGYWFRRRIELRRLLPVCQIAYSRTAFVGVTPRGNIRLTLDQGLRAVPVERIGFETTATGADLIGEHRILELKYRNEMPGLFKQLLEQLPLERTAISKYRLAAERLDLTRTECHV